MGHFPVRKLLVYQRVSDGQCLIQKMDINSINFEDYYDMGFPWLINGSDFSSCFATNDGLGIIMGPATLSSVAGSKIRELEVFYCHVTDEGNCFF